MTTYTMTPEQYKEFCEKATAEQANGKPLYLIVGVTKIELEKIPKFGGAPNLNAPTEFAPKAPYKTLALDKTFFLEKTYVFIDYDTAKKDYIEATVKPEASVRIWIDKNGKPFSYSVTTEDTYLADKAEEVGAKEVAKVATLTPAIGFRNWDRLKELFAPTPSEKLEKDVLKMIKNDLEQRMKPNAQPTMIMPKTLADSWVTTPPTFMNPELNKKFYAAFEEMRKEMARGEIIKIANEFGKKTEYVMVPADLTRFISAFMVQQNMAKMYGQEFGATLKEQKKAKQ